jgi:uncharacterized integral membrane protein
LTDPYRQGAPPDPPQNSPYGAAPGYGAAPPSGPMPPSGAVPAGGMPPPGAPGAIPPSGTVQAPGPGSSQGDRPSGGARSGQPDDADPAGDRPQSADSGTSGRPAVPPEPPLAGFDRSGRVHRTRFASLWIGLGVAAIVLILLIIFIAQNTGKVAVHFLGFDAHVSLAVAILIAAVCGMVIAVIPGTVRIVQLRKALRRNAKAITADSEGTPTIH